MVNRFLSIAGGIILAVFSVLVGIILYFYFTAPVYHFNEPTPFSGNSFYNPYHAIDSQWWKKANFHLQSRAWFGLTDGRVNRPELVYDTYRKLGYDIITISDYMKINRFGAEMDGYIPVYEHGYGIFKTHQLCLGARQVDWRDYPFFQTRHHKQHIIDLLSRTNKALAINHPRVRKGYTLEDMKWLRGYDLIEALSNYVISLDYWDAALSNGHPVFIISNDDSHNVLKSSRVGKFCTFVNTSTLQEDEIIEALKAGRAYGVQINMKEGDGFPEKIQTHRDLPYLKSVEVKNDTLVVEVSRKAMAFFFSSDHGLIKQISYHGAKAVYPIKPDDSYVRTTILFDDNTRFYLNPIIRCDGDFPKKSPPPLINQQQTRLLNILLFPVVFIPLLVFIWSLRLIFSPVRKRKRY